MSWTNNYIKVPFAEKGRARDGVDCWGLVRLVYQEILGITLTELVCYTDTKDKLSISKIIGEESSKWVKVPIGSEKEFDVAVFRMCGVPMHVAIVVRKGIMLHSERGSGTYVTCYDREQQWSRRLEGFYRYAKHTN